MTGSAAGFRGLSAAYLDQEWERFARAVRFAGGPNDVGQQVEGRAMKIRITLTIAAAAALAACGSNNNANNSADLNAADMNAVDTNATGNSY